MADYNGKKLMYMHMRVCILGTGWAGAAATQVAGYCCPIVLDCLFSVCICDTPGHNGEV